MIDLNNLRKTIEAAPAQGGRAAIVTKRWLEEVYRELLTGEAALAELAAIRAERTQQA